MARYRSAPSGENAGNEGRMWVGMDGDESAIGREARNVGVGVRREERIMDWGAGAGAERIARGSEREAKRARGGRGTARTRARRGILWVFLCAFCREIWLLGRLGLSLDSDMSIFRASMWICRGGAFCGNQKSRGKRRVPKRGRNRN